MKDARTDNALSSLHIFSGHALLIKKFAQFFRHGKYASLPVLCLARIESDFAGGKIDLSPLECEHLAIDPPRA
jgi:hypothetical protein